MGAKNLQFETELEQKYLTGVDMTRDDLLVILSHLRNARYALEGGADGVVMAAIKISDNIICKCLFNEVIYPEMIGK